MALNVFLVPYFWTEWLHTQIESTWKKIGYQFTWDEFKGLSELFS